MITIEQAIEIVLKTAASIGTETVLLHESPGRVLARDIVADCNVPFEDNSAMDGYAVVAADTAPASDQAPVTLRIIEDIPAGSIPHETVVSGSAARIFTGAIIPSGADAVLMQEYTRRNDDTVTVFSPVRTGANIRRAGEDLACDTVVLHRGKVLRAADTGILSSAGASSVEVARRPIAGIITTGNEIIEPSEPMSRGKVRNTNGYTISAMSRETGALPIRYDIVSDNREAIENCLDRAAVECDLIITSGGVSVGDYDLVGHIVKEKGALDFWNIAMKPGKPHAFGSYGGKPFIGLPGNPVSVMVGFEMFVRPMMLQMMGAAHLFRKRAWARLEHDVKEKSDRVKILRGIVSYSREGISVKTTGAQGSGILASMRDADCFIFLPQDVSAASAGDMVEIMLLA